MNVEAQAIDVPTGAQDYRPAYYGGISAVELGVNGVRRVAIDVKPEELQQRIALAYTNASRNSGINNWDVTKRHIDGDAGVQRSFARIRDIAAAMRTALERRDWPEVGRQIARRVGQPQAARARRHDARRSTPCSPRRARPARSAARSAAPAAAAASSASATPPTSPPSARRCTTAGARVLDFTIEARGLVIDTSEAAVTAVLLEQEVRRSELLPVDKIAPDLLQSPVCRNEVIDVDNLAIARVLTEIGDLLEIKGENPFKIRAYRNAAETIVARDAARRRADARPSGSRCRASARTSRRRSASCVDTGAIALPPGAAPGVPADGARPAAPAGRRTEDGRAALRRARHPHARGARAGGARRAHPRA